MANEFKARNGLITPIVTSTVSTGTAPFVVSSTTPVANLSIGGSAATCTTATNQSGGTVSATTGIFSGLVTSPTVNMNRAAGPTCGVSWYNTTYNAWVDYMGPAAATTEGPKGNLTAPTGTLVTSWGKRSFIENSAGMGWTFESGSSASTTPSIVAEIRSSDGAARFGGNVSALSFTGPLTGNVTGTCSTATNQSGGTVSATAGSFSGLLTLTQSNGTASSSGTHLKLENSHATGQTCLGFTFGGTAKASLRVDYGGNMVFNSGGGFYFNADLGSNVFNIYNGGATLMQLSGANITLPGNLTNTGVLRVPSTTVLTPATQGTYAAGFGNSTVGDAVTIGSDATNAYIQSWGSRTLQINSQGNSIIFGGGVTVNSTVNITGIISGNGKQVFNTADGYLRMNETNSFVNGVWCGTSNIQIGNGAEFCTGSNGTYNTARVRIRGGTYNGSTAITLDGSNGDVTIIGTLYATAKSFRIKHPTKPGKQLTHGSLEGPENAIYVRGQSSSNTIELPEYWTKLVNPSTITVQLTSCVEEQGLFVKTISKNKITIGHKALPKNGLYYFYMVMAERIDTPKLVVESDDPNYGD